MKKSHPLRKRETTPFMNIIYSTYNNFDIIDKSQHFIKLGMSLHNSIRLARGDLSLINFHKKQLGKQDYCITTYRRYYVWERPLWRVFIHKDAGVSLEVPLHTNPDDIEEIIKNYLKQLNVELQYIRK